MNQQPSAPHADALARLRYTPLRSIDRQPRGPVRSAIEKTSIPNRPRFGNAFKTPQMHWEVEQKFRRLAREVLSDQAAERLLEALWRLDTLEDAGDIVRLAKGA